MILTGLKGRKEGVDNGNCVREIVYVTSERLLVVCEKKRKIILESLIIFNILWLEYYIYLLLSTKVYQYVRTAGYMNILSTQSYCYCG